MIGYGNNLLTSFTSYKKGNPGGLRLGNLQAWHIVLPYVTSLSQRSTHFFWKGPDRKYLGLCGPSLSQLLNSAILAWKERYLNDWEQFYNNRLLDLGPTTRSLPTFGLSPWKRAPVKILSDAGTPVWLHWLSIDSWFQLRSWSPSLWIRASHLALCWQHGACFRFLSPSLFLLAPLPRALSLSLKISK